MGLPYVIFNDIDLIVVMTSHFKNADPVKKASLTLKFPLPPMRADRTSSVCHIRGTGEKAPRVIQITGEVPNDQ